MSNHSDRQDAIRLLALRILVEGAERALARSARTGEDSVRTEGGRPSGRPPAPLPCPKTLHPSLVATEAHRELLTLLRKDLHGSASPQETRRTAELLEFLDRDEEARPWWEKAARRGDRDAQDYLEILDEERDEVELSKASPYPGIHEGHSQVEVAFPSHLDAIVRFLPAFFSSPISFEVLCAAPVSIHEQHLVHEIEEFLTGLGPMTDGRRR